MTRLARCFAACTLVALATPALAADLAVPADFATVEDAAAVAEDGDRIVLSGTFDGGLDVDIPAGVSLVGAKARISGDVNIRGDRVTLLNVRFNAGHVYLFGDDARVVQCRLKRARLTVAGDSARVSNTRATRAPGPAISVFGAEPVVIGNRVRAVTAIDPDPDWPTTGGYAIRVLGDAADVRENRVSRSEAGIVVRGAAVTAESNVIATQTTPRALFLSYALYIHDLTGGSRAAGNRIRLNGPRSSGLVTQTVDAFIQGNVVRSRRGGTSWMSIHGTGNVVHENRSAGVARPDSETRIFGDDNDIRRNRFPRIRVAGERNIVEGNIANHLQSGPADGN